MVEAGSPIVCLCGFYFGGVCAEIDFSAKGLYADGVTRAFFVAADASVFRGGVFAFFVRDVEGVLGGGGEAEVEAAIVDGFAIAMVDEEVRGGVHNEAVHRDLLSDVSAWGVGGGVMAGLGGRGEEPFILDEPFVVFGIDESKAVLREGDEPI